MRPRRRRTWTVQSYSPGGANVHTIYRKPKNGCMLSAISEFFWPTTQTPSITNSLVAIVHTKTVNSNFSPKIGCHCNVPQHSGPSSNMRFLRPVRDHNPNGISIGSAVFAQMTVECLYTLQPDAPSEKCPFRLEIWTPI